MIHCDAENSDSDSFSTSYLATVGRVAIQLRYVGYGAPDMSIVNSALSNMLARPAGTEGLRGPLPLARLAGLELRPAGPHGPTPFYWSSVGRTPQRSQAPVETSMASSRASLDLDFVLSVPRTGHQALR